MPNAAIRVLLATELWRIKPARQARALAAHTYAPLGFCGWHRAFSASCSEPMGNSRALPAISWHCPISTVRYFPAGFCLSQAA
jgi:hypothetical protein